MDRFDVSVVPCAAYDDAQVEAALRAHFPGLVYETTIPRNVRLSEAPSHGQPCLAYDKSSKGARAYLHLANEFLKAQKRGRD